MANPPYFTTHFDLAFPLPILFFRWWFSSSPEHFYDEWFDSLWSWPQKQSRTIKDTISLMPVFRVCGIPILPRIHRLYFWDRKFQISTQFWWKISENFMQEPVFLYISRNDFVISYGVSWAGIVSEYLLDVHSWPRFKFLPRNLLRSAVLTAFNHA